MWSVDIELIVGWLAFAVADLGGGTGALLLFRHGLAGSSRELRATAGPRDHFRELLMDQRGHEASTRRPVEVSREAFLNHVVKALGLFVPGWRSVLVGQSMGTHTALLVAGTRPHPMDRVVVLEGLVAGDDDPGKAASLGQFFAAESAPFRDEAVARTRLGSEATVGAWAADMEPVWGSLRSWFAANTMERAMAARSASRGGPSGTLKCQRSRYSPRLGCSPRRTRVNSSGDARLLTRSISEQATTMRISMRSTYGFKGFAGGCCASRDGFPCRNSVELRFNV